MKHLIGVDGGGTKTELILVDPAGVIVARQATSGCNPSHVGAEPAAEVVKAALQALVADAPLAGAKDSIAATHLYMAGSPEFWTTFAAALSGYGHVTASPDSLPALELATDGAPGLVLHAGTGSFVAARAPDGSIHYAGGLGWKLGDPGSGFELGRRGIAHALLELQGWSGPSELSVVLKKHTGLADSFAITRHFYGAADANAQIAAFAPRVIALAQSGCQPAQAIVVETLSGLVAQARLVTDKLFSATPVPCGVSGAVLNNPVAVCALRAIAETNQWPVDFRFITDAPIEGVRRLLARAGTGP
ncbi:MAG: BadF/BadG/BcrA/BcrD ATPase family protein [Candidatus Didemnitutus sp.]|nr:BadF/BadG/BcrA/BcrD ATPase family protein [Candidatus Didemnitutus sp.]